MHQDSPSTQWNGMKRRPIGEKRRAQIRTEEGFYPAWEDLLCLHRLDYWHCTVAQRSQAGWPDYVVFGLGWLAFVELKARSATTKRVGRVTVAQERYKASIEAGGGEWKSFLLPDEWHDVDVWLNGHTGNGIWGWDGRNEGKTGGVVKAYADGLVKAKP